MLVKSIMKKTSRQAAKAHRNKDSRSHALRVNICTTLRVQYRQNRLSAHVSTCLFQFLLLSLIVISLLSCSKPYNTYYVRMDGSDLNNGRGNSSKMAWATIPHAVSQLRAGDHL